MNPVHKKNSLNPVKVFFCWTNISGYMAGCWRELASMEGIDLKVLSYVESKQTSFNHNLMAGIDWKTLSVRDCADYSVVEKIVFEEVPDILVVSGWLNPAYRILVRKAHQKGVITIMGMDNPWKGTLKQHVAKYVLGVFFKYVDHVVVTGERSWQYARKLGFSGTEISKGLYGVEVERFKACAEEYNQSKKQRSFLFVGRYSKEKGVDLLIKAYQQYRRSVLEPWDLCCYGQGEWGDMIHGEGITKFDFIQPAQLYEEMSRHSMLVLPSYYDPWPLVLVESCSAGVPVIASDACGSSVELIRHGYSGMTFASGSDKELAQCMIRAHRMDEEEVRLMGLRAQGFAMPYSVKEWSKRWLYIFEAVNQKSLSE